MPPNLEGMVYQLKIIGTIPGSREVIAQSAVYVVEVPDDSGENYINATEIADERWQMGGCRAWYCVGHTDPPLVNVADLRWSVTLTGPPPLPYKNPNWTITERP